MSLILETIQQQKITLSKKKTAELNTALYVALTQLFDASLGLSYNRAKDNEEMITALQLARRTFATNI